MDIKSKVILFLKKHPDASDGLVDDITKHLSETPKTKKKSINYYIIFRTNEIQQMKDNGNLPETRTEINETISSKWKILKSDTVKYDAFMKSAKPEDDGNTQSIVYQVTKPFHKFSLENRADVEKQFADLSSSDITQKLKDTWKSLSRKEKDIYNL